MLSLVLFFLVISSGSIFACAFYGKKYEETVPLTIFCSIGLVFLFGLLDNLKLGFWVLCTVAIMLYALSAYHVCSTKEWKRMCTDLLTPAFFIFVVLLVIYTYTIIGRVAWRGDEFSFWASSVKKMWYLNMLPCVPEAEPYFTQYPPGMQIFQYILIALKGSFSEWRMNMAYMTFVFALFLPFLKEIHGKYIWRSILICAVIFSCGTIVYPDALDNLMVDFALGATFAYGMAKVFLLEKRDNHWSTFEIIHIIMAANTMILIKNAGMLMAVLTIVALLLSVWRSLNRAKFVDVLTLKRRTTCLLGLFFLPFLTALLWKIKYSYYKIPTTFSNTYDFEEFFGILLGSDGGYRTQVKDKFISFMCTEKIQIGFFALTNIQFAAILIAILFVMCYNYRKRQNGGRDIAAGVLVGGLVIYWAGLLASYMYTFPESGGLGLDSMQRFLNIYFVAIVLLLIFILLEIDLLLNLDFRLSSCIFMIILSFASHTDIEMLLSGKTVEMSIENRAPYQVLVDQFAKNPALASNDNNGILLIYRHGYPHIPVNHFTYLMWPQYQVPWECSYGNTLLFEGDVYTKVLTADEFQTRVFKLDIEYIAIGFVDEDFINCYSELFDATLTNGQVYRVSESGDFNLLRI